MPETTVAIDGLLDRLRAGSEEARRELLGRAYLRLEVLARRQVRGFPGVGETGDVLHDLLLKLDRVLLTARPETPAHFFYLAAWHVRRVLVDLARRRRPVAELAADPAAAGDGPATAAEATDAAAKLHDEVDRLPTELREVVDLLHYQGLTAAEAAGVIGVSDRTVKKRWRDARLTLHAALGGSGEALEAGH